MEYIVRLLLRHPSQEIVDICIDKLREDDYPINKCYIALWDRNDKLT
jgi:hypothetical protein